MSPEDITKHREAIAYLKDVKEMIITDARAFYATQGFISRSITYDVITAQPNPGQYQAILIFYPDITASNNWHQLYPGHVCKTLTTSMKHLWDGVQTCIGEHRKMHEQWAKYMSSRAASQSSTSSFATNPAGQAISNNATRASSSTTEAAPNAPLVVDTPAGSPAETPEQVAGKVEATPAETPVEQVAGEVDDTPASLPLD